jgi:hypothetical protein
MVSTEAGGGIAADDTGAAGGLAREMAVGAAGDAALTRLATAGSAWLGRASAGEADGSVVELFSYLSAATSSPALKPVKKLISATIISTLGWNIQHLPYNPLGEV